MSKPRKAKSETATKSAVPADKPLNPTKSEKFEASTGYWQIEIADQKGQRYSNVYRCKSLDKAKDLAGKISTERHIPIVTKEPPPARTATEPAAPDSTAADATDNADDGMPMPF